MPCACNCRCGYTLIEQILRGPFHRLVYGYAVAFFRGATESQAGRRWWLSISSMVDHAFEKGTVGAAPALVDGGAVRASAPGPVEFKTLVDPSPELETVVLNFGPSDYATIGTFFVVNALGGWRFGGAIRGPTAGTTGMLGALAGFLYCYGQTSYKLMGIKPW